MSFQPLPADPDKNRSVGVRPNAEKHLQRFRSLSPSESTPDDLIFLQTHIILEYGTHLAKYVGELKQQCCSEYPTVVSWDDCEFIYECPDCQSFAKRIADESDRAKQLAILEEYADKRMAYESVDVLIPRPPW